MRRKERYKLVTSKPLESLGHGKITKIIEGTRHHGSCGTKAFHTSLMEPAGAKLLKALRVRVTEMNFPRVDVRA